MISKDIALKIRTSDKTKLTVLFRQEDYATVNINNVPDFGISRQTLTAADGVTYEVYTYVEKLSKNDRLATGDYVKFEALWAERVEE